MYDIDKHHRLRDCALRLAVKRNMGYIVTNDVYPSCNVTMSQLTPSWCLFFRVSCPLVYPPSLVLQSPIRVETFRWRFLQIKGGEDREELLLFEDEGIDDGQVTYLIQSLL